MHDKMKLLNFYGEDLLSEFYGGLRNKDVQLI